MLEWRENAQIEILYDVSEDWTIVNKVPVLSNFKINAEFSCN